MPMVVIEGMDGSGKTTLINSLRKSGLSFWGIFRSKPIKTLQELEHFLLWMGSIPPKQLVILDRHPIISEEVYGPILRNENLNQYLDPLLLRHQLKKIHLLIYCDPPFGIVYENICKGDHLKGVLDHSQEIYVKYTSYISDLFEGPIKVPVMGYDYTGDPKDYKLILEKLNHVQPTT